MRFVVYVTCYSGNKMPPFYIGSSSLHRLNKGYKGSVTSKQYSKVWKEELQSNPHLFKTHIISIHDTRQDALNKENKLQIKIGAHRHPLYINKSTAHGKFGLIQPNRDKIKEVMSRDDVREKLKESSKIRWSKQSERDKVSKVHKGKIESPETRKRKSESAKKRKWSDEVRHKMSMTAKKKWQERKIVKCLDQES